MNTPLLPDRYPQGDLFIANLADVVPKGDVASMGYPIFMLSSKAKTPSRVFQHENGNRIEVQPSALGYATVHDRDILIFAISQLVYELNNGGRISQRVRFFTYDFLRSTNRMTSGQNYELFKTSINRLKGTTLLTNIKNGGRSPTKFFGLIDEAEIIKEDRHILEIAIKLPDWIMDAIHNMKVLTLHRDYFMLRKATEKRIYELGRRFCGDGKYTIMGTGEVVQRPIRMNIDTIQELMGSVSTKKEFVRSLKKVIQTDREHNHLPEYGIELINRMSKKEHKGLDAIQASIFPKNEECLQILRKNL